MAFSITHGGRPFHAACDGGGLLEEFSVSVAAQAARSDLVVASAHARSPFYQCTQDRIAASQRPYGTLERSIPSTSQFIPFKDSEESELPEQTSMVSLACSSELTWGPQSSVIKQNGGDCQASVITATASASKEGGSNMSPARTEFSISTRADSTKSLAHCPHEVPSKTQDAFEDSTAQQRQEPPAQPAQPGTSPSSYRTKLDAALREVRAAADRPSDERPDKKDVARYVSALLKADWLNEALKNELQSFLNSLCCTEDEGGFSLQPRRPPRCSSVSPIPTLLRVPSTDTHVISRAPLESQQQKCADLSVKIVNDIPSNLRSPMIHNRLTRTQGHLQAPATAAHHLTPPRRTAVVQQKPHQSEACTTRVVTSPQPVATRASINLCSEEKQHFCPTGTLPSQNEKPCISRLCPESQLWAPAPTVQCSMEVQPGSLACPVRSFNEEPVGTARLSKAEQSLSPACPVQSSNEEPCILRLTEEKQSAAPTPIVQSSKEVQPLSAAPSEQISDQELAGTLLPSKEKQFLSPPPTTQNFWEEQQCSLTETIQFFKEVKPRSPSHLVHSSNKESAGNANSPKEKQSLPQPSATQSSLEEHPLSPMRHIRFLREEQQCSVSPVLQFLHKEQEQPCTRTKRSSKKEHSWPPTRPLRSSQENQPCFPALTMRSSNEGQPCSQTWATTWSSKKSLSSCRARDKQFSSEERLNVRSASLLMPPRTKLQVHKPKSPPVPKGTSADTHAGGKDIALYPPTRMQSGICAKKGSHKAMLLRLAATPCTKSSSGIAPVRGGCDTMSFMFPSTKDSASPDSVVHDARTTATHDAQDDVSSACGATHVVRCPKADGDAAQDNTKWVSLSSARYHRALAASHTKEKEEFGKRTRRFLLEANQWHRTRRQSASVAYSVARR